MSNAVCCTASVLRTKSQRNGRDRKKQHIIFEYVCTPFECAYTGWCMLVKHTEREEIQPLNRFLYMRKIDINVLLVPETILFCCLVFGAKILSKMLCRFRLHSILLRHLNPSAKKENKFKTKANKILLYTQ